MNNDTVFYGILKSGEVLELKNDSDFDNFNLAFLIKKDFIRNTLKGFPIFNYSIFIKGKMVNNRTIKWGNISCRFPEKDIWDSVSGNNHKGVVSKIILNETFELTFLQKNTKETIVEIMELLIFFKNHNTKLL